MSAQHTPAPTIYPSRWEVELVRNASGRAWWLVSRFVARTRFEYIQDISGAQKYFRLERDARIAVAKANGSAA